MATGESLQHRRLKALALHWAVEHGFLLAGCEVRVPRSGYRADVAACRPGGAASALFECKQARADFRKDAHDWARTQARLAAVAERRRALEALLSLHRPDLRRGESLFPEYDSCDFAGLEHQGYREVLAELATLQERVRGGTKFARLFRYRSADLLYLVVEDDLHALAERPAGWGVLVRRRDGLELVQPPAALDAAPRQRQALLEAIALAGMRAQRRALAELLPPAPVEPLPAGDETDGAGAPAAPADQKCAR